MFLSKWPEHDLDRTPRLPLPMHQDGPTALGFGAAEDREEAVAGHKEELVLLKTRSEHVRGICGHLGLFRVPFGCGSKKGIPTWHLGIWKQRLKPARPSLFHFEPHPFGGRHSKAGFFSPTITEVVSF